MWLCLNNAFLSVVNKQCAPDELLVRARRKGDIERVFPSAKVIRSPGTDYLWRAPIKRDLIAAALAKQVESIAYDNFKNSVRDDNLHDAYGRVWHVMAGLQETAPYSGFRQAPPRRRGGQKALPLS